ncbi:MAG: dihydrofolate reductase [Reyranella sp.]|uniref:dihydrofolate reductase n=1 Tax=Reyranella sp. TaxID=1929291 RepID=UPI0027316C46|nr:dihydrofolate reductase [Reyranella sp.]MDP1964483.1 dihydrofolate reductase [Reyranella sp.]MDP2373944.1 dihydrofolate reductase [Reyranella sp.]
MTTKRPRIEGFAVVSREGMIAGSDSSFPEVLKIPADQEFYQASLDRASAIANGRHSAEGGPKEAARRRIVLTRRVQRLMPDPKNAKAVLWNPATAPFDEAWQRLGVEDGMLAVVGGTDVFGLFLNIGYDAFHLTCAKASVPRGRPVFPGVGKGTTPADVLTKHGLVLCSSRVLDAETDTVLEEWGPKG